MEIYYRKFNNIKKIKIIFSNNILFGKFLFRFNNQILKGLNVLHKMNIMHRDLKSANVFLLKN